MTTTPDRFHEEVARRLPLLTQSAKDGDIARAADLLAEAVAAGGVITAFGTGHSEAFAMEIAGRAGGLIPTSKMALRDIVLHGDRDVSALAGSDLERDGTVSADLFNRHPRNPRDAFIIISNSGVNSSIVGVAELVKQHGHPLVVVTSLEHTNKVNPKHASGKRLKDFADVVLDNLAPYGDSTLELDFGMTMGAISSITGAFIAQLLTLGIAERLAARGLTPPVYLSANIPGGDEHNQALTEQYAGRLRIDA